MKLPLFLILLIIGNHSLAKKIILTPAKNALVLNSALKIAEPFDTIVLKAGVYDCINECINKPITLLGEKGAILDGHEQNEVLVVTGQKVRICGLEIKNSKCGSIKDYAGIRVFHTEDVTIEECLLQNTFFGIYLSDVKRVVIRNCSSKGAHFGKSDTGNGIHLWKCDSILIENNTFQGHRDGIYLEFAKHCLIKKNACSKNFRYGLHFMFSDNDEYRNNQFTENGTGVAVMYSQGVHMFNNIFANNWGDASYGLLLKDMTNGIIQGNTFTNNTVGITMEGGNNMRFTSNRFTLNGYAIKVMANCRLDTFRYNSFYQNTFDAATNGELQDNLFEFNFWDKYEGYDLNRDGFGDVPYRPVSLYAVLVEKLPFAIMLIRSFTIDVINRAERSIPSLLPETFVDIKPLMKKIKTHD
ncbi:MAG: nitrous oxide reductase family maturation protein NosD [Chitinophagales bacterium]